jgi:GMP reductase
MTQIIEDVKLDFQDVLLVPKRSTLTSRSQISLERVFTLKHADVTITAVPIIVANMDTVGTMEMAKALFPSGMCVALHKFYPVADLVQFFGQPYSINSFYSMGITDADMEKFRLVNHQVDRIHRVCVDVANGYSSGLADFVETLRAQYPHLIIMAGNVVTPDMTYDLIAHGADIVKIGIGPGSVCTTRKITGVGYPQLSAIMECADAAHGVGGHICGDGGVTCPGDIVKAFAGGADFVMSGGLFAGHAECDGEIEYDDKNYSGLVPKRMKFYGMSSKEAMDEHYGGKASYRAAEGKCVTVPYKGPVSNTVEEILGGLRSACTYVGASQLKHLPKCATFVRTNRILNNVFGT